MYTKQHSIEGAAQKLPGNTRSRCSSGVHKNSVLLPGDNYMFVVYGASNSHVPFHVFSLVSTSSFTSRRGAEATPRTILIPRVLHNKLNNQRWPGETSGQTSKIRQQQAFPPPPRHCCLAQLKKHVGNATLPPHYLGEGDYNNTACSAIYLPANSWRAIKLNGSLSQCSTYLAQLKTTCKQPPSPIVWRRLEREYRFCPATSRPIHRER